MKQVLITASIALLAASTAFADEPRSVHDNTDRAAYRSSVDRHGVEHDWRTYRANEFNLDLFGTGTVGKQTLEHASVHRVERDGRLGAGVGLSYFLSRYIGVEAEAYSESTAHNFIDNVGGNLVGRLPIGNIGLAPYIFGGGGRQCDPLYQWTLDAGAGLEWRVASRVGIFVDARYVWADKTRDYGLGRLGLKFGF